jgi:integrase
MLSDLMVRQAKTTGKTYTLADSDGLSLFVAAHGAKAWHFRFTWGGKRDRMSFGSYPALSLKEARELRDEARNLLAKGVNPHTERKRKRHAIVLAGEHTFQAVYDQWLTHRKLSLEEGRQTSLEQIARVFKKDVFPVLRHLTIYDITRAHLLDIIGKVEKRGSLSVAEKLRTWFTQLFTYATVAIPNMHDNPSKDLEVVALPLPPVDHNPFLRMPELPIMLQTLRKYRGRLNTQLGPAAADAHRGAHRRTAFRHARPVRPRTRPVDHPGGQAQAACVAHQEEAQAPGGHPAVHRAAVGAGPGRSSGTCWTSASRPRSTSFPGDWSLKQPVSENTFNGALKRMGYEDQLTGHGIRATISTALNELGYPKKWVDAQLSHADPDKISATYNHAEYVEQRRVMMQDWADRLDLFEQNQVEVASRHLTITLQGLPTIAGQAAAQPPARSTSRRRSLIVTAPTPDMPAVAGIGAATVGRAHARVRAASAVGGAARAPAGAGDLRGPAQPLGGGLRQARGQVAPLDHLRNPGRQPAVDPHGQPRAAGAGLAARSAQAQARAIRAEAGAAGA